MRFIHVQIFGEFLLLLVEHPHQVQKYGKKGTKKQVLYLIISPHQNAIQINAFAHDVGLACVVNDSQFHNLAKECLQSQQNGKVLGVLQQKWPCISSDKPDTRNKLHLLRKN